MSEEVTGRVLRTILKPDVYNRLEEYSKTLSTGIGKWDFGVAIERLLDFGYVDERFNVLETRMDMLETNMLGKKKEKKDDEPQLLGRHHLKGEKKNGKD